MFLGFCLWFYHRSLQLVLEISPILLFTWPRLPWLLLYLDCYLGCYLGAILSFYSWRSRTLHLLCWPFQRSLYGWPQKWSSESPFVRCHLIYFWMVSPFTTVSSPYSLPISYQGALRLCISIPGGFSFRHPPTLHVIFPVFPYSLRGLSIPVFT